MAEEFEFQHYGQTAKILKLERISRAVTLISQAGHGLRHPYITAPASDGPHRQRERTTMTMIFDGLHAETYRVAIGLQIPKRNADCSEFAGLVPPRTSALWVSIAAAWSYFWEARGESEFGFPSDY
jgi:hypothetical protein